MDINQFLARYAKPAPDSDCILWQKYRMPSGYGTVRVNGYPMLAHRRAYELCFGPIPDGMIVRHSCDNPPCVNPRHLQLGTQTENMADCVSRGRHGSSKAPEIRHGANNGMAKLTEAEVLAIRNDPRSVRELGRIYGVSKSSISNIKRKQTWFRVKPPQK